MKSDKDDDDNIDKKEAKELALKIALQLQAYDVGFDTEKFLKVVAKDPSVTGVIAIVLKLLPKEEEEEEKEKKHFDYESDSDEDSDEEDSEDSDLYGEFCFIVFNRRLAFAWRLLTLSFEFDFGRYVLHGSQWSICHK